ncbi:MAG: CDP-diacylglycerol--serine O-phosphatidyltransferase [Deltaproteobacteria bacterium]|nr:CDP-diacylglycerol--serine O-phosphatidyltransferase [Deltaproteobacteria bacterium]
MKRKSSLKRRLGEKDRLRRGIYVLPNLCTTLNLFCGFLAIIFSMEGKFSTAAFSIIIAGMFDGLDGKIARATGATSQFGVEYDSLADLISFGLAPGLMMYLWILSPLGRVGWLAAFLFTVCGALRLARFNTQTGSISSDHFTGLPIPAAAGMLAGTVLFAHKLGFADNLNPILMLLPVYGLSFLMVSNIRYISSKKSFIFRRMNFNALVGVILVFVFIVAQPAIALFLIGFVYVASGPILALRHRKMDLEAQDEVTEGDEKRPRTV